MIEIRPVRREDDRHSFTSADVDLDRFFRKFAVIFWYTRVKWTRPVVLIKQLWKFWMKMLPIVLCYR